MRLTRLALVAATLALAIGAAPVASARGRSSQPHVYRWYQHIFVIMLENHGYDQIIGNPLAPRLNGLARTYGLATHFYAITHPSEPNYISLIGGSNFGIRSDSPYTINSVTAPNLADQLEAAGLTWRSYQQGLPRPGYTGVQYPVKGQPMYLSKHNPFLNFVKLRKDKARLQHIVPITALATDLQRGHVPNFALIVPDLCHDMHGQWPMCRSAHSPGDANDRQLVRTADAYVGNLAHIITSSPMWAQGNNAVVITWDENDFDMSAGGYDNGGVSGCCDASPGGGHIATIVVTSHGPRGVKDPTPYNHYAILRTIQVAFHLGCLQHTCDTKRVHVMRLLFTTTGKGKR